MKLVNLSLKEANEFVQRLHRHCKRVQGYKFAIGAELDGKLVGVAIVGRPISRTYGKSVAQVTRLCTDGTPNACSFLYSRAKRAAQSIGFERVITHTLQSEDGASLRAVSAKVIGKRKAERWDRDARPRSDAESQPQAKVLWEL